MYLIGMLPVKTDSTEGRRNPRIGPRGDPLCSAHAASAQVFAGLKNFGEWIHDSKGRHPSAAQALKMNSD